MSTYWPFKLTLKIKNILTGWGRRFGFINTPDAIKVLAEQRVAICISCKYSKPVKLLSILNGRAKRGNELYCTQCNCPCLEKALVLAEKCPKNKWPT